MANTDHATTLATLRAQRAGQPLSILALTEPITASQLPSHTEVPSRISDTNTVSTEADSSLPLTPATLSADLSHYKDLFSKLRFSYLEQVTKEKYLRSIVGDPPLLVSHEDNLVLEERLGVMKAELKSKKADVDTLVEEMEARARDVATAHEGVSEGMDLLEKIPVEIDELRADVERLQDEIKAKRGQEDGSSDPRMQMSLAATEQALSEQRERNAEIDLQITELQRQMPGKVREVEKMDRELTDLERRRNESTRLAVEGRRRREEGGRDEMEDLGRWYRASESVMQGLLGVEG